MKKIILLSALFLIFACNQKGKKNENVQQKESFAEKEQVYNDENIKAFLANFEEKSLPVNFDNSIFEHFMSKRVQVQFLPYIVGDTTGKIINANDGLHYSTDYFYKYHIKTNKDFDLIILGEYPYPPPETFYQYFLYTISPQTGEVYDKILLLKDYTDTFGSKTRSLAKIDKNLNINVQIIDSIVDYNPDNEFYPLQITKINKNYTVNAQKKFVLQDSLLEEKSIMISENGQTIDSPSGNILIKYWSDDFAYLNSLIKRYNSIKSAKDIDYILTEQYNTLLILNKVLEGFEADAFPGQDTLNKYMPFITIGYGPEGCCSEADPRYYPLYKKALKTPEKDDDVFFDAFQNVYARIDDAQIFTDNIFIRYESLEDAFSNLGNHSFIKAFTAIQSARQKTQLFSEQFDRLFDKTFSDLTNFEYFTYSKDEVLAELEQIVQEIKMDDASQKILNNYIEMIKNKPENAFNHKLE